MSCACMYNTCRPAWYQCILDSGTISTCMRLAILPVYACLIVYRLKYTTKTNTFTNPPEVVVEAKGFGGTRNVEYLDVDFDGAFPIIGEFHIFVEYFVNHLGYKIGKDIRAAPYDWRLAAGIYNHAHQ